MPPKISKRNRSINVATAEALDDSASSSKEQKNAKEQKQQNLKGFFKPLPKADEVQAIMVLRKSKTAVLTAKKDLKGNQPSKLARKRVINKNSSELKQSTRDQEHKTTLVKARISEYPNIFTKYENCVDVTFDKTNNYCQLQVYYFS